ncbi:MAG TPA: hypothetical protein HPP94_06680 [Desulfuromonadales bacterium]|nr:hypothetical protein [Desulfuromonadales bacterium]
MTPKTKEPIGSLVVKHGFATQEQIHEAIEEQNARKIDGKNHVKLGLLLVQKGIISPDQLLTVVENYNRKHTPISDDAMRIAVKIRIATMGMKVILFTGIGTDDSDTLLMQEVGCAISMMDQGKVLLLDLNFKVPTLHSLIDSLPNSGRDGFPGVRDVLEGVTPYREAIHHTGLSSLFVMPTGNPSVSYSSIFLSSVFVDLINKTKEEYLVMVQCPPLLKNADTALIASQADGAVVIVRSGRARKNDVIEVQRTFDALNVPIIGAVLTSKK